MKIIDLSVEIDNKNPSEEVKTKIKYIPHKRGAFLLGLSSSGKIGATSAISAPITMQSNTENVISGLSRAQPARESPAVRLPALVWRQWRC